MKTFIFWKQKTKSPDLGVCLPKWQSNRNQMHTQSSHPNLGDPGSVKPRFESKNKKAKNAPTASPHPHPASSTQPLERSNMRLALTCRGLAVYPTLLNPLNRMDRNRGFPCRRRRVEDVFRWYILRGVGLARNALKNLNKKTKRKNSCTIFALFFCWDFLVRFFEKSAPLMRHHLHNLAQSVYLV